MLVKILFKHKQPSIFHKLLFWFLLLSLVPTTFVAVINYYNAKSKIIDEVSQQILFTAKTRETYINNWFNYRFADVQQLAGSPITISLLQELSEVYKSNSSSLSEFINAEEGHDTSSLGKSLLLQTVDNYDYIENISIIDKAGNALFSVVDGGLGGGLIATNIYDNDNRLSESVKQTLTKGSVEFSDLIYSKSDNDNTSGFISAPIWDLTQTLKKKYKKR